MSEQPPPYPYQQQPPPSYLPQQQAYAPPPQHTHQHAHPHPEPRPYPLILRTWTYALWRPLVGIVTLAVGMFVVMPLVLFPLLMIAVLVEGGSAPYLTRVLDAASLKQVTPAAMLYLNLTLASLTLVVIGIVRFVHGLRPRWLSSVKPGMRWKFFAGCLGLSVVAIAASLLVGLVLPQDPNQIDGSLNKVTGELVALAVVILLTTPLQALGEEYAFRGYLMQAFGALAHGITEHVGLSPQTSRRVAQAAALTLTSLLFALAHGVQNFPLFFDRFAFGLMAGLVVILVGGLEAGIALHVLNNLFAFGLAIAFGDVTSTLTVSEVSWWQLPVTIVQNGVYLVLVLLWARHLGLRNTTSPPVAEPAEAGVAQSAG